MGLHIFTIYLFLKIFWLIKKNSNFNLAFWFCNEYIIQGRFSNSKLFLPIYLGMVMDRVWIGYTQTRPEMFAHI